MVTLPPLLRVVEPGAWIPGVAALTAVTLAVGFVLRRRRMPAVAVTLVQVAVWAIGVTVGFFSGQALFGFLPTGGVLAQVPLAVRTASDEILQGIAPIAATDAISFVIVAGVGLLAVALDHVVLTARMPLLAGAALIAVWLIPAISVPAGVDVALFALLAASLLFLIRAENRTRETPTAGPGRAGVGAVATAIGAVAIVGALVIAPTLPAPTVAAIGPGVAARIDPSLDLGNDLRRREDLPVLTMRSDAPQLPYLRVTTLSMFDGEVWMPDRMRSVPLDDSTLEPVAVDDGIRLEEYRTTVAVSQLSSMYLPIPYPAVAVDGLEGMWRSVPYSRTILSANTSSEGQEYAVTAQVAQPTLEQIRASSATIDEDRIDVYAVPEGTPAIIGDLAREVTADAATDYDKLIALQSWFRGSEFTYSLTAPVEEGFDDTGVDAVAAFLQEKEGYCIHYAGAFALMARTLGMPSRIVVGFLPGERTGDTVDGQQVAQVTTSQLHAWPEVNFAGIGWVAFEPTKSLGFATRFSSAATASEDAPGEAATPTPTAPVPTAEASRPADAPEDRPNDAAGATAQRVDPRPQLALAAAIVLIVSVPGLVGLARRRLLRRRGTVGAAWRIVQDAAIDLGAPVGAAASPRVFGALLTGQWGAPAAETSRLVAAMEHVNYARAAGETRRTDEGARARAAQAIADAETIRRAMFAQLDTAGRVRARLAPRSLVVRPGSALADRDATA